MYPIPPITVYHGSIIENNQCPMTITNKSSKLILFELFPQWDTCNLCPSFGYVQPSSTKTIKIEIEEMYPGKKFMQLDLKYWFSDTPQLPQRKLLQYLIRIGRHEEEGRLSQHNALWGYKIKQKYESYLRNYIKKK